MECNQSNVPKQREKDRQKSILYRFRSSLNHNSKTNMCAKKEQITTEISIIFGKEKEKKIKPGPW